MAIVDDNDDDYDSDENVMKLMFDEHQFDQLCGPDGGFTSAGRDSLLFQVKTLFYSYLQHITAKV